MPLSFKQIPSTLRTPFVFAEVDPSNANDNQQAPKSVLAGQIVNGGPIVVNAVATNAATTANGTNNTLAFATAGFPAAVKAGQTVLDVTALAAVTPGTTVLSIASGGGTTTVTLSAPVASNVGSADSIQFIDLTALAGVGSVVNAAATIAATPANGTNKTLSFATGSFPAGVKVGQTVVDRTATTALPQGTTVLSIVAANGTTTVTLSAPVANAVGSGDSIEFDDLTPRLLTSQAQVNGLYGRGSMIAEMYGYYRMNAPYVEVWGAPIADDPAGVKAAGTIVVAGAVSVTGVLPLYVNGVSVPVVITSGMTVTQIHAAIASAINAAIDVVTGTVLAVTATSDSSAVTVAARNAGAAGNDHDLRLAYLGPQGGEAVPSGLSVTITPFSGGATNPATGLSNVLNSLLPIAWGFVALPYSDASCLNNFQTWENDVAGQWAWSKMKYGSGFAATRGTVSTLQTFGTARNDQHVTVMGFWDSPSTPTQWAAAYAGAYATRQTAQAGSSSNDMPLLGILAPPLQPSIPGGTSGRFGITDQNTLLWAGVSTFHVGGGGEVLVQKAITTYQADTSGDPDDSYLQVDDMFRLAWALSDLKSYVQSRYAGASLVDDDTQVAPGLKIVSPKIMKAVIYNRYLFQQSYGIVEDDGAFLKGLQVTRNDQNRDRLDVLWPAILVGDFDIMAVLAQFSK